MEEKVIIAGGIELDFSGLFEDATRATESPENGTLTEEEYKNTTEEETAAERNITSHSAPSSRYLLEIQEEQEERRRNCAIAEKQAENIRKAEALQAEILHGTKAGEDIYSLFLKAALCIAGMTGNEAFYNTAKEDLLNLYGHIFNEKPALEIALGDVKERLERLRRAKEQTHEEAELRRLWFAIQEHEQRQAEIEEAINA